MINVQLLCAAVYFLTRSVEPVADRILAGLLVASVGILTPHMIGFAGFYDAFPWLSFAPFSQEFLLGPLVAAYVYALTHGTPKRIFWWCLIPAACAVGYETYWFIQPLEMKWAWAGGLHNRVIAPVFTVLESLGTIAGLLIAIWLGWRYRTWLDQTSSNSAEYDLRGLGLVLITAGLALSVAVTLELVQAITGPFTYLGEYPFYLAFGIGAQIFALTAMLQPENPFPKMTSEPPDSASQETMETDEPVWKATGDEIAEAILSRDWYLEPRLSLTHVANRLNLSESLVSKSINLGLGTNFNQLVNGFRIERVKSALISSDLDMLSIAYDSGFNSKATFNRVFKEMVHQTPRQFRQQAKPEKC